MIRCVTLYQMPWKKQFPLICKWCRSPFLGDRPDRQFCGKRCSSQSRWTDPAKRAVQGDKMRQLRERPGVAEKLVEYLASERNPFHSAEVRQRGIDVHRQRGYAELNGGNGRGRTVPQRVLAAALGWPTEYVVRTGADYQPHHYKIDIAQPELWIAIEVDGASHKAIAVQAADRRKDEFLRASGWEVLRFTNEQVMRELESVLQAVASTTSKRERETT